MTSLKRKLSNLTVEEHLALSKALTPRTNRFIPIELHAKQKVFLLLNDILEVLFGGAAGPGKSWGLLAAAAQFVDVPNYSALLLRRSYKDLALPGALMDISHQWWDNTDAKWSGADYQWEFPSGAVIQFGYLEHEGDEYRYQSSNYQFIGFDELTQFQEHQYLYMFSRLRRAATSNIPLRMRAASNPGGVGHEWVKRRFNLPSGLTGDPHRVFVSATLDDNPHLDVESYERALAQLGAVTYEQLRHGDWDTISSGGVFSAEWFQIIGPEDLPHRRHWERIVRHWDMGSQAKSAEVPDPDYTAGCKMIRVNQLPKRTGEWFRDQGLRPPPPPYYIVLDVRRFQKDPGATEEEIRLTSAQDGYWVPVSLEQEKGASGKSIVSSYKRHVLTNTERVIGLPLKGSKEARAARASGLARQGRVFVLDGPYRVPFINELSLFGIPKVHDDQVDAFSGCFDAFDKLDYMAQDTRAIEH